jgi:LacI family transcriptional regulator
MHAVADYAGVSPMSVSNVINGRSVRPATREAVLRAIAALNYKPNAAARALASASTMKVGLLYSSPDSAFVSALLVGALDAGSRCGAQILLRRVPASDFASVAQALRALIDEDGANALLLPAPHCETVSGTGLVEELNVPIVALCPGSELSDLTSVRVDDFKAAFDMTMHLIGLGHRRIGFIRAAQNHIVSKTRFAGYTQALEQNGISTDAALVVDGDLTFETGLGATEALLGLPEPPSAIFASNDDTAAAVMSVAHRRNLRVPEQLSIAGFDDSPISRKVWPQITTIRQPIVDMTSRAVELLAGQFNENAGNAERQTVLADFALLVRGSTASPAAAAPI